MTDQELQRWVEQLSLMHFGIPFAHLARFNSRLRTTGGRYHLSDHRIEMNPKMLEVHGREVFTRIILHELCHYHLHIQGKGYRHRDRDFRELLEQVGGLRYAPPLHPSAKKNQIAKVLLTCKHCGKTYYRKRKVNLARYICGDCRGPLEQQILTSNQP
ncbi:SprT family protein [Paenactinomyces guangxiensis]|uniref:Protein SprT-like n=1 Tax=Paenactinomyces guangxiensis TaxID=1490290 RepID=A0A7W1WUA6_9BACL|nr:SprT family protein [Paenactinomyces guangxiensis]MBA4496001.1 SprT family protein [Paenactinomyces guangxiensis]MBH8593123.1 SprT family protein [Paenactinomyces guangxiensis]